MSEKIKNNIPTEAKVIALIDKVKEFETERGFDPIEVYTKGDCGNLFFILKEKFPQAIPYVHRRRYGSHIITKIDNEFYDIRGKYKIATLDDPYGLMMCDGDIEKANLNDIKRRSYNYNFGRISACKSNREKLPYLLRQPVPAKVSLKTRLGILRDDFKHVSLKDIPVYFKDLEDTKQKSIFTDKIMKIKSKFNSRQDQSYQDQKSTG